MQLSRTEFDQLLAENKLRIAFVGMSNIGKSYTGSRIAAAFDFELVEVDKLIWEELGQGSMADFAAWQGQPYSEGYAAREAKSVSLESLATSKAVLHDGGNAILDTTGSVIYIDNIVQEELLKHWYIVHISASEAAVERLKVHYFQHPKPLIWNGFYQCDKGQTPDEAILASYPKLLAARAKAYAELADATISCDVILDPDLSIEEIFERLKPAV